MFKFLKIIRRINKNFLNLSQNTSFIYREKIKTKYMSNMLKELLKFNKQILKDCVSTIF